MFRAEKDWEHEKTRLRPSAWAADGFRRQREEAELKASTMYRYAFVRFSRNITIVSCRFAGALESYVKYAEVA